jgi:nucleoid-associated protein YgaU
MENLEDEKIEEESKFGIISEEIGWVANDYEEGDIEGKTYTVVEGDTLWEIAEAVYGSGFEWGQILDANSDSISYLPNGSQALIVPGQVLELP